MSKSLFTKPVSLAVLLLVAGFGLSHYIHKERPEEAETKREKRESLKSRSTITNRKLPKLPKRPTANLNDVVAESIPTTATNMSQEELWSMADQLISKLRSAGFSSPDISVYFQDPRGFDPRLVLAVLDRLAASNDYSSICTFIEKVGSSNLHEAVELVKLFPNGEKFNQVATALVSSIRVDDKLAASHFLELLKKFPSPNDQDVIRGAIQTWIIANANQSNFPKETLSDLATNGEYGGAVSSSAAVALIRSSKVQNQEIASLISQLPPKVAADSFYQICDDLLKRGATPQDIMDIANSVTSQNSKLTEVAIKVALGNSSTPSGISEVCAALSRDSKSTQYADKIAIAAVTNPNNTEIILNNLSGPLQTEVVPKIFSQMHARGLDDKIAPLIQIISNPNLKREMQKAYAASKDDLK